MVPELLVSDQQASRAFYTEVLGFAVLFERAEDRFSYLGLGGAQLMILQDHPQAWRTADLRAPRGRGCNLQIEVDDVTSLRDRILAAGHSLFRDLADETYDVGGGEESQRELLVQDPDGYLLRLVQPLSL
ncbi:bleomycin resistance protein [Nocardia sp. NPDC059228]|uniref:bleomycin resistance protein n=1 Tax=Nocardia sp. NPDC059228 TaxID=3346777 RepID=UPI00368D7E8A